MLEIKTKFFYPHELNKCKYEIIMQKSFILRLYRNFISQEVFTYLKEHKQLPSFFDLAYDFAKLPLPNLINKDKEYAIKEVITAYNNKLDKSYIKKFCLKEPVVIQYYKKNTKKNRKGDIKSITRKSKQTEFTNLANFFLHKGLTNKKQAEDYIEYVLEMQIPEKIKNTYRYLLEFMNSRAEDRLDRLFEIVRTRSIRLFEEKWTKPIFFQSRSYRTLSRISQEILGVNKNKQSIVRNFISIGNNGKPVHIPVQTSSYHLNHDFVKSYSITFLNETNFRIDLVTEIENPFDYSGNCDLEEPENFLGIDVNIKNNILACSTGVFFDLPKELKKKGIELLKKADKRENTEYILKQKEKYRNTMIYENDKMISRMLDYAVSNDINHIVLEDLGVVGSGFRSKNKELDISYGRLASFLNLDSLKNRIRRQAHNRGISVSFVPPEHTSQKCNICKHVSKANRPTQEVFLCTNCGHTINADTSSSSNVKEVVIEDALRESFLIYDELFNEFNVKPRLSRDFIRVTYLDIFHNRGHVAIQKLP